MMIRGLAREKYAFFHFFYGSAGWCQKSRERARVAVHWVAWGRCSYWVCRVRWLRRLVGMVMCRLSCPPGRPVLLPLTSLSCRGALCKLTRSSCGVPMRSCRRAPLTSMLMPFSSCARHLPPILSSISCSLLPATFSPAPPAPAIPAA